MVEREILRSSPDQDSKEKLIMQATERIQEGFHDLGGQS
jgi:hypothetical protein